LVSFSLEKAGRDALHTSSRPGRGGQANHGIGRVVFGATALTAGARWLAFVSPSTNLHPPNANSLIHTYLRGPLY
jgi:hypothetical protein